jgi:hypothetical protein
MDQIHGVMDVKLTDEQVVKINTLIARNEKMPLEQKQIGDSDYLGCPACGRMIFGKENFCCNCGQRIDCENIAL